MIRSYQGKTPAVPASCYVDVSAQLIGDVTLGENASIWMNAVLRGDVHSIRIGANSNVQDCSVLHGMRGRYPVILGDWVTVGHSVTLHGCTVEDACLIGMGAVCCELQAELIRAHLSNDAARFLSLSDIVDQLAEAIFIQPMEGYITRLLWALAHLGVIPRAAAHDPWGPALPGAEFEAVGRTLTALGAMG